MLLLGLTKIVIFISRKNQLFPCCSWVTDSQIDYKVLHCASKQALWYHSTFLRLSSYHGKSHILLEQNSVNWYFEELTLNIACSIDVKREFKNEEHK
jgi:hypothetical protein